MIPERVPGGRFLSPDFIWSRLGSEHSRVWTWDGQTGPLRGGGMSGGPLNTSPREVTESEEQEMKIKTEVRNARSTGRETEAQR